MQNKMIVSFVLAVYLYSNEAVDAQMDVNRENAVSVYCLKYLSTSIYDQLNPIFANLANLSFVVIPLIGCSI